jgi:hypothetical protein
VTPKARIATLVVVLASTALVVGGYPLARRAWIEHQEKQKNAFYADGLSPCDAQGIEQIQDINRALPPGQQSEADVSITVFPSFSLPKGIRIAGTSAFAFRLGPSPDEKGAVMRGVSRTHRIEVARHFSLSPGTASAIRRALSEDIRHAIAENELGLDGTTFVFQVKGGGCAQTWSPETTRAGAWAALADALLRMADRESAADGEAELRRQIEVLRTD